MIAAKSQSDARRKCNGLQQDKKPQEPRKNNRRPLKKKIMKKKTQSHKDKKINSNTNFSTIKNHSNSQTTPPNHQEKVPLPNDQLLLILKSLASDPERYPETSDASKTMQAVSSYKTQSHKIVFTDLLFNGVDGNALTPQIFTRKNQPVKPQKPQSPHILAFENYLHLITQMYYKKSFNLLESIANFEGVVKEAGRPGRKAKNRPVVQEESQNGQIIEEKTQDQLTREPNSINKDLQTINFNQDILSSLVSPIRKDLIFEKWGPKEIAIFEGALCKYGKQFLFINHLIPSKSFNEIIEFYQAWKQTSHYKIWKYYKNIGNRSNFNHWL